MDEGRPFGRRGRAGRDGRAGRAAALALLWLTAACAASAQSAPAKSGAAKPGVSVDSTGAEGGESGVSRLEPAFRLAAGGRAFAGPVADGRPPAAAWLLSEDRALYALTESGGLVSRTGLGGESGRFIALDPFGRAVVSVDSTLLVAVTRSGIEAYRSPIEPVPAEAAAFAPAFGSDGRAFALSGMGAVCFSPAGRRLWSLALPEAASCAPGVDASGRAVFGLADGSLLIVSPYGEEVARLRLGAKPVIIAPMAAAGAAASAASAPLGSQAPLGSAGPPGATAAESGPTGQPAPLGSPGPSGAAAAESGPTGQPAPLGSQAPPSLAVGLGDGRVLILDAEGGTLGQAKLGTVPRSLIWDGNLLYGLDAAGTAFALDASGALLWSTPTGCSNGSLALFEERVAACGKGRAVSLSLSGEVYRELSVPDATGLVAVTPGGYAFSSGSDWVLAAYRFERPLGPAPNPRPAAYAAPPDAASEELLYDAFAADADRQMKKLGEIKARLAAGEVGKDEPRFAAYCVAVASGELLRDLSPAERRRLSNPLPRSEAAYLLGDLGSPDYRGFLIGVLERDPDPAVRAAACQSLAAIGVDPGGSAATAFYEAASRPVDERTALAIVEALGGTALRFGLEPSPDAVRALVRLAEKPYLPGVRSRAAWALSRLAGANR